MTSSEATGLPSSSRRAIWFVAATIAVSVVTRVLFWFRRDYGHDDFYLAYLAWIRSTRAHPGTDFEAPNFTPLAELLSPLFGLTGESFIALDVGRAFVLVASFVHLGLVYKIARQLGSSVSWGLAAVAVASWQSDYVMRIADVRADPFSAALLLGCASVLLAVKPRYVAAGLLYGGALALSYKYALAAPFLTIAIILRERRGSIPPLLRIGAASALPPAIYLVWRTLVDGWPVVRSLLVAIVRGKSEWDSPGLFYIRRSLEESPVPFILVAIGITGAIIAARRGMRAPLLYSLLALGFCALYVSVNPFVFPYNFVLFTPLLAPVAGQIENVVPARMVSLHRWGAAVIALAALLGGSGATVTASQRTNVSQKQLVRWIWRATDRDERVWDWQGMHFGRQSTPHWYFFGAAHDEYVAGQLYSLPDEWRSLRVSMLIDNFRFRYMTETDGIFMRTHFVQMAPCIWVPGSAIPAERLRSGATFENWVGGYYRLVPPNAPLLIDGSPARPVNLLQPGFHRLTAAPGVAIPPVTVLYFTTPRREGAGRPPCPAGEPLLWGLD